MEGGRKGWREGKREGGKEGRRKGEREEKRVMEAEDWRRNVILRGRGKGTDSPSYGLRVFLCVSLPLRMCSPHPLPICPLTSLRSSHLALREEDTICHPLPHLAPLLLLLNPVLWFPLPLAHLLTKVLQLFSPFLQFSFNFNSCFLPSACLLLFLLSV